ncbi:hypothetical protein T439DRAFT_245356 [Meredithblackwellia eburnea MCA 4105]
MGEMSGRVSFLNIKCVLLCASSVLLSFPFLGTFRSFTFSAPLGFPPPFQLLLRPPPNYPSLHYLPSHIYCITLGSALHTNTPLHPSSFITIHLSPLSTPYLPFLRTATSLTTKSLLHLSPTTDFFSQTTSSPSEPTSPLSATPHLGPIHVPITTFFQPFSFHILFSTHFLFSFPSVSFPRRDFRTLSLPHPSFRYFSFPYGSLLFTFFPPFFLPLPLFSLFNSIPSIHSIPLTRELLNGDRDFEWTLTEPLSQPDTWNR